ncbi:MAG: hypothetical protein LAO78_28035 [Acidobacteriia bacterium]|nr:hypothetical protein [Terriglobia bacterium]
MRLLKPAAGSVYSILVVLALSACAQELAQSVKVGHGTVVVIFFSKERVVLAADSRLTYSGPVGLHKDNQCKVSNLGHQTIFAASGFNRYNFPQDRNMPKFDVYQQAVQVSRSYKGNLHERGKAVAEAWAQQVKAALDIGLVRHPAEVMSSLHGQSMQLASGVFAGKSDTGLAVYHASILCECRTAHKYASIHISQLQPVNDGVPAASIGTAETMGLFSEVADATSPRGLAERDTWKEAEDKPDRDANVTIRTGEFILHHSKDRTIGGPLNAIELTAAGAVRWVKREKNCQ